MKRWGTTDASRSGRSHLWRQVHNALVSECGILTSEERLQPETEAFGRCQKCERYAAASSDIERLGAPHK